MTILRSEPRDIEIYRLKLPLANSALRHVNAYLVIGDSGHLLVDTGWKTEDTFTALENHFEMLGIETADISTIVITHVHIDHFGLIGRLKKISNAEVIMHKEEENLIDLRYRRSDEFARRMRASLRQAGVNERYIPPVREIAERFSKLAAVVPPDRICRDGDIIRHGRLELQVLWTPGHSPGHICLYDVTRRLLFSGDHVLPHITPHIGYYPQSGQNPLGAYMQSLQSVRRVDADWVLPAHGHPFRGLARRTEQILEHHRSRLQRLMAACEKSAEPQSAFDLVGLITWHQKRTPVAWRDLPPLEKRLAVFEVMAHLEALVQDGGLQSEACNGVRRYRLTVGGRRFLQDQ